MAQIKCGFGLAFDIEKAPTKSGFKPAQFDLGAGKELFGSLRLDGFASALQTGIVETLVIAGGDEGRYKNEPEAINRAWAIREMLVHDFGIVADRIQSFPSRSNTGGNIAIFKSVIAERKIDTAECCLVTNLYHLPRASMDLHANGLSMQLIAAEAFWLLEDIDRKNMLIERLGEGPLAERCAEEIQGVADKIRGTYKPRTDAAPINISPKMYVR